MGIKFDEICKQLDSCNKCNIRNEITCVEFILKKEINNDRKEYLRIKAECYESDFDVFASYIFSLIAILISVYSLLGDFINDFGIPEPVLLLLKAIVILVPSIYAGYYLYKINRRRHIKKWRSYILIVLEEIEKYWDEFFK